MYVIVEFGASWCGPCRAFLPHFTKFAEQHPEFVCVKVDVDVDPEVVSTYKIQSVPQVKYFVDGEFAKDIKGRTVMQLNQELGS
jgi:thiol-disulfide isomerase/thioredoxin